MNSIAHRYAQGTTGCQSPSGTLLLSLREAHAQLSAEMENLDRLTRRPLPELEAISGGRWRISQASLRRRSLALRIFDFLAQRLERVDLETLKKVRQADQEMLCQSASHVGRWTTQSICKDWPGYCDASRDVRRRMKAHLLFEKQFLYPLLEKLAQPGL